MNIHSLLLMMASQMSTAEIMSDLKKAISAWENATPAEAEECLARVDFTCTLLLSKKIAPDLDSAKVAMEDFSEISKAMDERDKARGGNLTDLGKSDMDAMFPTDNGVE